MNEDKRINRDSDGFEIEGTPEEPQLDEVYVLKNGKAVKVEVPDDDGDD